MGKNVVITITQEQEARIKEFVEKSKVRISTKAAIEALVQEGLNNLVRKEK